ncbi:MAG: N-acetylmuramidase domain-containing protein [Rhodocyclaceae bacterium]
MSSAFVGTGLPLDQAGLDSVVQFLGVGEAELWSVLDVETSGCGFTQDRKPRILFERHKFSKFTGGQYDAAYPDISNPQPGGYGATSAQYDRLECAVALDRDAALRSASWGLGQIMGYNAVLAGYQDAESMVAGMMESEAKQLAAMANFLKSSNLDTPLIQRNWADFAKGYNGAGFAINKYDLKLSSAYQKFSSGAFPDLNVRAAQLLLTYLGYHPGSIDGIPGKITRSALSAFLEHEQMPETDAVDDGVLNALLLSVQRTDA